MKPTNVHLTTMQRKALRAHARETGLTVAEIIRRAVDDYLNRSKT